MWLYFLLTTIIMFAVFATENYVIFVINQLELVPTSAVVTSVTTADVGTVQHPPLSPL
jgi:hypothetical protein